MKKRTLWVAVALMTALTACSSDDDGVLSNENNERRDITLARGEKQLVDETNKFAINLFRQVRTSKSQARTSESLVLSPISVTFALGMLNNGASGETQQQINAVLGYGDTGADSINAFCRKMLTMAPQQDKLTKVLIANTIYMNKGFDLLPGFVQTAQTYYDATPETRDFRDGRTMDVINQWASDHTEHMIKKVLDESSFNPDAVSYLLNAIYFKGAWANKFDKGATADEDFHPYGQPARKVPMMQQTHDFGYGETANYQVVSLPYGNGAYSMTILLPKEGFTIDGVLQDLTLQDWPSQTTLRPAEVDLKLPRFESSTDIDLVDVMSQLGMPRAFTDAAEFPNFCNAPTYIGLMKQVARIKLNEEGTEAAAVTVIGMDLTSAGPSEPQPVAFHATRPFLYVISEQSTGAIFFIGQYMGES